MPLALYIYYMVGALIITALMNDNWFRVVHLFQAPLHSKVAAPGYGESDNIDSYLVAIIHTKMPRTTLSAVQAELLDFTETLLVAADLLNDDLNDLGETMTWQEEIDNFEFRDDEDAFDDFVQEVLEMHALVTFHMAFSLTGDGSRGSYNQYAKSADFFSTTLQSPDHQFRHQFR
jgi:hypothetical protein